MEITTPSAKAATERNGAVFNSPEPDPKRTVTSTKPLSFTNGVLKRQRHHIAPPSTAAATYKECLKNHAAALGGHALDGCGEFMPDRSSNPNLPISLKCAACGCHRNFHRRDPADHSSGPPPIEYHRHQSPVPLTSARPRMLLALSTGLPENTHTQPELVSGSGGKRFRTKFSNLQKEKMYEVAERVGWKMQKRDEELVNELCNRIGVGREVFKVWMHNNKSTFNKRSSSSPDAANANNNVFFHNGNVHHDNDQEVNATEQHGLLSHGNMNGANGGDHMVQHQHHHQHHHHHHSKEAEDM